MCDPKADPPDALKEGIKQKYEERKDFPEVLPQGIWDKVNVQRFSMKNCGSCEKKCKYYKVRAALKLTDGVVLCNQDFLTQHLMKLRRGQEGLINAAADLLVVDEAQDVYKRQVEENGEVKRFRNREREILFMDLRHMGSPYEKSCV